MSDAMYITKSALLQDQLKLESISQNVSNMQTTGFKRQLIENKPFDDFLKTQSENINDKMQAYTDLNSGTLMKTDKPAELAISGSGFFEIQNNDGVFYTRSGEFHIDNQGDLSTAQGAKVLGQNGAISINDSAFKIDTKGNVWIEGHKTDRISVVDFSHPQKLQSTGSSLYSSSESPVQATHVTIKQGFLEQSNVQNINEMLSMIKISRHFELVQRLMKTANSLLGTAINQLGEGNV